MISVFVNNREQRIPPSTTCHKLKELTFAQPWNIHLVDQEGNVLHHFSQDFQDGQHISAHPRYILEDFASSAAAGDHVLYVERLDCVSKTLIVNVNFGRDSVSDLKARIADMMKVEPEASSSLCLRSGELLLVDSTSIDEEESTLSSLSPGSTITVSLTDLSAFSVLEEPRPFGYLFFLVDGRENLIFEVERTTKLVSLLPEISSKLQIEADFIGHALGWRDNDTVGNVRTIDFKMNINVESNLRSFPVHSQLLPWQPLVDLTPASIPTECFVFYDALTTKDITEKLCGCLLQRRRNSQQRGLRVAIHKTNGESLVTFVEPNSTVHQLKAQLINEAPMQFQQITFSGVKMDNDRKIKSYNVMPDDVLNLIISKSNRARNRFGVVAKFTPPENPVDWIGADDVGVVFVFSEHIPTEKQYWGFRVTANTTGYQLSEMVRDANICGPTAVLMSRLDILNPNVSLKAAGVKKFDKIFCFEAVGLDASMMFKVSLISRQTLEIYVSGSQTAYAIKEQVREKTGIAVKQQILLRRGVPLDDLQPLSTLGLEYGALLQLELQSKMHLGTGVPIAELTKCEPTVVVVTFNVTSSVYSWSADDLRESLVIGDHSVSIFNLDTCAKVAGRYERNGCKISFYPEELLNSGRSLCIRVNPNLVSNICGSLAEPYEFFHNTAQFPLLVPVHYQNSLVAVEFDRADPSCFDSLRKIIANSLGLKVSTSNIRIKDVSSNKDAASLDEFSVLYVSVVNDSRD